MTQAFYYPSPEMNSEYLIKSALLLWDNVRTIVPWKGYESDYRDALWQRAMDGIARPIVPTDAQKETLHKAAAQLLNEGLLQPLRYRLASPNAGDAFVPVSAQKLLWATWQMLREHGYAGRELDENYHELDRNIAYVLLALAADACATSEMMRVTDKEPAYAAMMNNLRQHGQDWERHGYAALKPTDEVVVPLSLEVLNVENIPLTKLIEFREREHNQSEYRMMRHAYFDLIRNQGLKTREDETAHDRIDIAHAFQADTRVLLLDLQKAIGCARLELTAKISIAGIIKVGALMIRPEGDLLTSSV
jgi:hypothetical protein